MRFRFCPDCGAPLTPRDLGDDAGVPWCAACQKPWFDMFSVATISLVHDGAGRVLLLRQDYISPVRLNLVSGYVQPGERAEDCAVREIREETGLTADHIEPAGTWWFAKKQMLMVGFYAHVAPGTLRLSSEVDAAHWVTAAEAPALVHQHADSTSRILTVAWAEKLKTRTT